MAKRRTGTASVVLVLAGCTAHDAASRAPVTPVVPAPKANAQASEEPPAPANQSADFGPPGRYAVDIHKTLSGTRARDWANQDSRASFVLELEPNGQASACRGIHARSSYYGDSITTHSNTREQQGYRGRWQTVGQWVQIELSTDDTRCAKERLYENREPRPWHLRCRKLEPSEHDLFNAPLLACALENAHEHQYRESFAFFVPEVITGEWLLLGPGDGLHVDWHDDTVPTGADLPKIELKPPQGRVTDDTWTRD